jgi:ATP-binding cassette subfamily F protein 3
MEEMLQLSGAGKRFGTKLLLEEVNWLITPDERTGLVGGNGTGKSTMLKVLAGIESLGVRGTRYAFPFPKPLLG